MGRHLLRYKDRNVRCYTQNKIYQAKRNIFSNRTTKFLIHFLRKNILEQSMGIQSIFVKKYPHLNLCIYGIKFLPPYLLQSLVRNVCKNIQNIHSAFIIYTYFITVKDI